MRRLSMKVYVHRGVEGILISSTPHSAMRLGVTTPVWANIRWGT
jgi:hypothetical protein